MAASLAGSFLSKHLLELEIRAIVSSFVVLSHRSERRKSVWEMITRISNSNIYTIIEWTGIHDGRD